MFRLFTSVGQREKILSPHKESNLNQTHKNYAIDIADPSSMQDACHMNFVTDLALRGGSVVEHWSMESRDLKFDSSWGLNFFSSLSHTRDKTKHISLCLIVIDKLHPFYIEQVQNI